ncbi:hypothetical protein [Deinococcus irradiatisoli]|nr:hypothetical protein [Deinococcus irradiatisoli]
MPKLKLQTTLFAVGPAALCGLALSLSACAPTLNLGNVIDTTPSPAKAGPLLVGQTWAISGQLAGESVSKTLAVPRLTEVQNGSGTLSLRDQVAAAQVPSAGYEYVSYTNNDQLKQVHFVWNVAAAGGIDRYECLTSDTGSLPLVGVLTLQRQGDATTARGTCSATPTNPPPAPASK